MKKFLAFALIPAGIGVAYYAGAQGQAYNPEATLKAQKEAMAKLAMLDGVWRGPAWSDIAPGHRENVTQTERVGPFLDGTVKVVEGRAYAKDGSVPFNAFAVISYNPATQKYSIRTYSGGRQGDYPLTLTAEGFDWEIPAGPMTIKYKATIKDGVWHEVGYQVMPGKEPVQFMEMTVRRVSDTTWPAGNPVPMK